MICDENATKKVNSSHIDDLDMSVGLDNALSIKPVFPVKFAFEPNILKHPLVLAVKK